MPVTSLHFGVLDVLCQGLFYFPPCPDDRSVQIPCLGALLSQIPFGRDKAKWCILPCGRGLQKRRCSCKSWFHLPKSPHLVHCENPATGGLSVEASSLPMCYAPILCQEGRHFWVRYQLILLIANSWPLRHHLPLQIRKVAGASNSVRREWASFPSLPFFQPLPGGKR